MIRLCRGAGAALVVATLAACSTDAVTAPGAAGAPSRSLAGPADGVFTPDVSALALSPGDSRQVAVSVGGAGRPVPAAAVAWSSDAPAIATVSDAGLVTAVAPGTATITVGRGPNVATIAVTVDRCVAPALPLGTTAGEISTTDCYYAPAARYGDYYTLTPAAGEVVLLQTAGLDGIVGVKEATDNFATGTVFGSRRISPTSGATFRVIGNGDPLQLFLSGVTATTFGAYTVTRTAPIAAHECGALTYVVPGASFATTLTEATACRLTIQFSPFPDAIGKPIATQRYWTRLEIGRPYTVTLGGVDAAFNAGLTIFPNVMNGAPVAQAVGNLAPGQTTRTVTFTPTASGYHLIEISSGRFVDGAWVVQEGDYTLDVSR